MRFQKYLNKIRDRLANKLLNYFIKKRINNIIASKIFIHVYYFLTQGFYTLNYKKAKHHYIPKFLLKKFKIGDTGKIFEYKKCKQPTAISIKKKAALIPNLYSFRDKKTKQQSDFIEDVILARTLERYAPYTINRILNDDLDLTNLERSLLDTFVAFQYTRTPYFFFQLEKMLIFFLREKSITIEEISKKDFFKKAFIENHLNINRTDVGQFIHRNRERLGGDIKNLLLKLSSQIANHISQFIFYKNLYSLKVSEPEFLFLTDHPVVMFSLKNKDFIGPMLWELKNSMIFLPLSPTRGIYYLPEGINDSFVTYGFLRELSLYNKYFFIYSDRKSTVLDDFLQKN